MQTETKNKQVMSTIINNPIKLKGRVGEVTFYQRAGATVVRIRHNEPNHRSPSKSQRLQRSQMSNLINFWRSFPEGQRPEYQHRRSGVTNYNMFVASGLHAHRVYLPHRMTVNGGCVATDVLMSEGLLPEIEVRNDGTAFATNLWLGDLVIDSPTTVSQLARAIVQNNIDYLHGDSLFFYLCEQCWDRHTDQPVVRVRRTELVIDLTDERPLQEALGDCTGFAQRDGWLAASRPVEGGVAWVHLRHSDEGNLLSTQRLVCDNPLWERYSEGL